MAIKRWRNLVPRMIISDEGDRSGDEYDDSEDHGAYCVHSSIRDGGSHLADIAIDRVGEV